jgi:Mg2+-importing ATPase
MTGVPPLRQVGLPNLLDKGVLKNGRKRGVHAAVEAGWRLVDEIPFDFERRLLSVVLRRTDSPDAKPLLVCKV